MSRPPAAFVAALDAIPVGTCTGISAGKRYTASKSVFNSGRSLKLVAHELGGPDYISLNLYRLASGPKLFPCEMPAKKVTLFVLDFEPDQAE